MKIMAVSDIHGSIGAARKIIRVMEEKGADRLLILGDILYHGPRNDLPSDYAPKEVIAALNGIKEKILAVRGNCDTEVDQMVLEFPIMADYMLIQSEDLTVFATHGHKINRDKDMPYLTEGSVFLYGHTHVTEDVTENGIRFMNPGSLPIPKAGSVPSYIMIENGRAELSAFDA